MRLSCVQIDVQTSLLYLHTESVPCLSIGDRFIGVKGFEKHEHLHCHNPKHLWADDNENGHES